MLSRNHNDFIKPLLRYYSLKIRVTEKRRTLKDILARAVKTVTQKFGAEYAEVRAQRLFKQCLHLRMVVVLKQQNSESKAELLYAYW